MDFRNATVKQAYCSFRGDDYEELAKPYVAEHLPEKLGQFSAVLGSQPWMAGSVLTLCDFPLYELIDQNCLMFGRGILDGFDNLVAYLARFEALPGLSAAIKAAPATPCNNVMAYTSAVLKI